MRKDIIFGSRIVLSLQCASCLTTCSYRLASSYVWVMVQAVVWAAFPSVKEKESEMGMGSSG